jgi:hypothetical protein
MTAENPRGYYILDKDGNPRPCPDLTEWALWFERADRKVARDELPDGHVVSTVFLGLDHNFTRRGPPILYETLVFNDYGEIAGERYATREEALEGHQAQLAELRLRLETGG